MARTQRRAPLRDAGRLAVGLIALGALAPASAAAVDRYVDAETGADTNPACPQANPCDSIAYALANSGSGDEIFLDSGSYPEAVTVGDGRSLTYQDFVATDGAGPAIVDGGAGTALTVAASGAGHIRGLSIRGDTLGVQLNGQAEVDGNDFDDPDATSATGLQASSTAAGSQIHDNDFFDPAPSATRARIGVYAELAAVDIVDNTFTGLQVGANASGGFSGTALLEGNQITGTHNLPGVGRSIIAGGIGPVIVRENSISAAAGSGVTGITVASGTQLIRNEITGHERAVLVLSDATGVSLEGDRIWGNSEDGLRVFDNDASPPQTSVSATNVTIVENGGAELRVTASALTLDSSIVEDVQWSGTASCAITFSRANAAGTDPSGCDGFQTTADPMLVDAPNGDLHLQVGSPMIDAGNPAAPPGGAIDFDGDPRALDATPVCSANVDRRDIGADEFVAAAPDCDPPETTFIKTPPKKTKRKTVRFKFEVTEPSSFACQLDDKPAFACGSPWEMNVKIGRHKFRVTATDNANNVEVEPAKYGFRRIR